jgi:hypothetical protein
MKVPGVFHCLWGTAEYIKECPDTASTSATNASVGLLLTGTSSTLLLQHDSTSAVTATAVCEVVLTPSVTVEPEWPMEAGCGILRVFNDSVLSCAMSTHCSMHGQRSRVRGGAQAWAGGRVQVPCTVQ